MNNEEFYHRLADISHKLVEMQQISETRVILLCESENAFDVNKFLFEDLALRFVIATGIDSDDYFEILYHYSNDETGCVITIKALIRDKENPSIESITPIIPGAEWIEREMRDILGIDFPNHPDMRRLILHDDWPEGVYPLRKEVKK
ncbi:MAG: NADH-quinone oxidoreductase subunit C [Planctomycetota bacterium]|jgi:Ni,Fe-hydrogenase III component G